MLRTQCPVPNGEYTVTQLGLKYLSIGQCAGILISNIVIYRCAWEGWLRKVGFTVGEVNVCAHREGRGNKCYPLNLLEEGADGDEVKHLKAACLQRGDGSRSIGCSGQPCLCMHKWRAIAAMTMAPSCRAPSPNHALLNTPLLALW